MWLKTYPHLFHTAAACAGLLLSATALSAQEQNIAVIRPTDIPAEIVRKAANVVPSERQFNWQRQELTAFLHYGVTTYPGR